MRVATKLAMVLCTIGLCNKLSAQQSEVIINLSEQTACLFQNGRLASSSSSSTAVSRMVGTRANLPPIAFSIQPSSILANPSIPTEDEGRRRRRL
jgi:hypothetical protein